MYFQLSKFFSKNKRRVGKQSLIITGLIDVRLDMGMRLCNLWLWFLLDVINRPVMKIQFLESFKVVFRRNYNSECKSKQPEWVKLL